MEQEIQIKLAPNDEFLTAKIFPKEWEDDIPGGKLRKEIDIIKLEFNTAEGKRYFYATPDEALKIAQILNTAVSVWLEHCYPPYKKDFEEKQLKISKSIKKQNENKIPNHGRARHSQKKKR